MSPRIEQSRGSRRKYCSALNSFHIASQPARGSGWCTANPSLGRSARSTPRAAAAPGGLWRSAGGGGRKAVAGGALEPPRVRRGVRQGHPGAIAQQVTPSFPPSFLPSFFLLPFLRRKPAPSLPRSLPWWSSSGSAALLANPRAAGGEGLSSHPGESHQ